MEELVQETEGRALNKNPLQRAAALAGASGLLSDHAGEKSLALYRDLALVDLGRV